MNTDHVVMQGNEFVCLHCGRRYAPAMPAPVSVFTAMTNAFIKDHKHCQPKAEQPMFKRHDSADFQAL